MNDVCPLCNLLGCDEVVRCEKCHNSMNDLGKIVDYLDEYSPYEDIQTLKCVDGLSYSIEKHKCLHLFHCSHCEIQKVIAIQEQTYI